MGLPARWANRPRCRRRSVTEARVTSRRAPSGRGGGQVQPRPPSMEQRARVCAPRPPPIGGPLCTRRCRTPHSRGLISNLRQLRLYDMAAKFQPSRASPPAGPAPGGTAASRGSPRHRHPSALTAAWPGASGRRQRPSLPRPGRGPEDSALSLHLLVEAGRPSVCLGAVQPAERHGTRGDSSKWDTRGPGEERADAAARPGHAILSCLFLPDAVLPPGAPGCVPTTTGKGRNVGSWGYRPPSGARPRGIYLPLAGRLREKAEDAGGTRQSQEPCLGLNRNLMPTSRMGSWTRRRAF